ncbi:MAG: dienelactone hydrolase family protein [Proteobacteria bacterium]|nr:dienelactone hydrolase family protein [Pseudomonadota bacterium]
MRTAVPLTRRGFVATSAITAGYTLAAGPVIAQTIVKTDTDGLIAGDIKVAVAGGEMTVYRAKPASGSNFPVVLVNLEAFGLHEYIKDVTRRLAKLGYLAVAPDIYFRQGNLLGATDFQQIMPIINSKPDPELMADLDATLAYATSKEGGDANRMAVTGFCRGGRNVWMYAAHNPKLKAAVSWYGTVVGNPSAAMPQNPIDVAATVKVPVLGLYGGADSGIPVDTVEKMKAALKAAGNPSEFVVYPDTPHGFHADYRPSYRPEQAADGWKRLQEWFKKNGVA